MIKYPDNNTQDILTEAIAKAGYDPVGIHFTPTYICDRCKDESKEAFLYGSFGFEDLCDGCYETMNLTHVSTNVGTFERQVCGKEGCDKLGEPCWLGTENTPDEWYCAEHMHEAGYCIGCGQFYAGVESFDFGPGWCDNCAPEFEEEDYYDEDMDFGFGYPEDDYEDDWSEGYPD